MNVVPLALYAAALVAYALALRAPAAAGRPRRDDAARRRRARAHLRHRHADDGGRARAVRRNATPAISTFVWLLALAYLYTEMTTDERAMGVFILPLLVALQAIPAFNPGIEDRAAVLAGPAVRHPRVVAALRLRELRARLRHRHHLRAAVQGDQGQAPRLLLHAAAVAAGARLDEPAGDRHRLGLPDDRPDRRRDLGRPGARRIAPGDPRVQAMSLQDPEDLRRAGLLGGLLVRGVRGAADRLGRPARRRICRRSASRSCC